MPRQKKEIITRVKGTRDYFEEDIKIFETIEEKAKQIASYYGFKPIITPILEKTELFLRSEEEDNPIVKKEMYAFRTEGKDYLVLRPEGTPPVIRAYFENGLQSLPQPVSLCYFGPFFRHESPQRGRYREFRQFGAEIFGETEAIADALVINLFNIILKELDFKPFVFHLNSLGDKECKKIYRRDLLNFLKKKKEYLCKDCRKRAIQNPLRFFDCKNQECAELKKNAPLMINYLCDGCKTHFKNLIEILDEVSVSYYLNHYLVRGLDYYSRTVFEIFIDEKTENENSTALSMGGGGRYNYLSRMLGYKDLPAVGGALGIERIAEEMKISNYSLENEKKNIAVFFAQLGFEAKKRGLKIFEELRKAKLAVSQSFTKDSLRVQLGIAEQSNALYTVILGQKELIDGTIMVKNMKTGVQETIFQNQLVSYLKSKI